MIKEDLVAERITIESYRDADCLRGERRSDDSALVEEIPAKEEEHAEDLVSY